MMSGAGSGSGGGSSSGSGVASQYNPFQGTHQYQTVSLSSVPNAATAAVSYSATGGSSSSALDSRGGGIGGSRTQPSTPQYRSGGTALQTPVSPMHNLSSSLSRQPSMGMGMGLGNMNSLPGSPIVNPKNLDAIISWLAFPRNLFLRDRHTQQEVTLVIDNEEDPSSASPSVASASIVSSSFILKWFEINPRDRGAATGGAGGGPILDERSVLKGYVYLQDIVNLQLSGSGNGNGKTREGGANLLILQLSSAARALKSSGGRTVLTFEFNSESECSKYFQGIHSLLSYKRQQQQSFGGRGMQ
jgi:hypothetical protein